MKVAVLADTHMPRGSRRLPDACVRLLEDAELILHAGDFVLVRGVSVDVLSAIEAALAVLAKRLIDFDERRAIGPADVDTGASAVAL